MSELGIWILEENGNFFRFHESKGRFQYAGKSREEAMKSKQKLLNIASGLSEKVGIGMYVFMAFQKAMLDFQ